MVTVAKQGRKRRTSCGLSLLDRVFAPAVFHLIPVDPVQLFATLLNFDDLPALHLRLPRPHNEFRPVPMFVQWPDRVC